MKKRVTFMACFLAHFLLAKAQRPDTASIIIHYKFSHQPDTNNLKNVYQENMILLVGKRGTAYKSYDARLADLDAIKQIQQQMASNGGHGNFRVDRKYGGTTTEYYLFPLENKMLRKEKLINSYLIAGPLPVINWQISGRASTIGGYHCQKVTTHFMGRNYTAWFCPDIPCHGGPWKLLGLPGVILEAYDTKKQVIFKFDGIDDVSRIAGPIKTAADLPKPPGGLKFFGLDDMELDIRLITLPPNVIKTNDAQFAKLKETMRKDPNALLKLEMTGPTGAQMAADIKRGPRAMENNPIELPEKK